MLDVNALYTKVSSFASTKKIDPVENLKGSKVFIFSGLKDSTVVPKVAQKGEEMYRHYGADVTTEYSISAIHTQPTNDPKQGSCTLSGSPYISYCKYDGAFHALNKLSSHSPLKDPVSKVASNLFSYKQSGTGSMGPTGYAYVPTGCQGTSDCEVHIAFHGCQQTTGNIGLKFVELTGYQEVAEANNIVVMFPQAKTSSFSPMNPNGCWDWWGYGESSSFFSPAYKYATKEGYQMDQVWGHLQALQKGTLALTPAVHADFDFEEVSF